MTCVYCVNMSQTRTCLQSEVSVLCRSLILGVTLFIVYNLIWARFRTDFYLFIYLFWRVLLWVWYSLPSILKKSLSKVGVPNEILEFLFGLYPKIPEAKGSIKAIRSEAFFIPLYELYITYGGIFRLNFGPKVS